MNCHYRVNDPLRIQKLRDKFIVRAPSPACGTRAHFKRSRGWPIDRERGNGIAIYGNLNKVQVVVSLNSCKI